MDRDSLDMPKFGHESLDVVRKRLDMLKFGRESLDVGRESLDIPKFGRESLDMGRKCLDITKFDRESLETHFSGFCVFMSKFLRPNSGVQIFATHCSDFRD